MRLLEIVQFVLLPPSMIPLTSNLPVPKKSKILLLLITFPALGSTKPMDSIACWGRLLPAGPMLLLEMVLLLTPEVALAEPKTIVAEAEPRIVELVIVLNWAPLSKRIVVAKL